MSAPSRALFNPMDLTGRTILVTGATSGLGRATALYLSRLGARLYITGRDRARLDETRAALCGDAHVAEPLDFSDLDAIEPWVSALTADHGPLDGAVHFAGQIAVVPVKAMATARIEDVVRINLSSAFVLARAFRKRRAHRPGAGLIFISSVAARKGMKGQSLYGATKGALISATKALSIEFVADDIRVNCIAPALVPTEGVDASNRAVDAAHAQALADAIPLGLGTPDDVAGAAAYLLADTGRWITGTILTPDGGLGAI